MSTVDPQAYPGLFERLENERRIRGDRLRQRRATAAELARLLAKEFSVERVVLFGSLARGESGGRLDIDLAVAGLDPELELRALAELGDAAGCSVDLVRIEEATPRLLAAIASDGVVLYERP